MSIIYDHERGIIKLDTPRTSYIMALADGKWLGHIYYGPRVESSDVVWVLELDRRPFTPDTLPREAASFADCFPWEYPVANDGDFRLPCLAVRNTAGQTACRAVFRSAEIMAGKPALDGLPATFGEDCDTVKIVLSDGSVDAELYYTAFHGLDVITRSVRIVNRSDNRVWLDRALSTCLHLPCEDTRLLTLSGSWAREHIMTTREIGHGIQGCGSTRGIGGHQDHPFLALLSADATQYSGEVWAMHLIWSGSFTAQVERDQFDGLRAVIGIHPDTFCWQLEPGDAFQAPEAVLTYSGSGLEGMTHTLHDLYRAHLIRDVKKLRPVLINNWEATFFDFDENKLLNIAREASKHGVDLFVLDDGWFGTRDTDSGSLGDWTVDRRKLPNGLDGLARRLDEMGMGFGLWMEPEMISTNSNLYRTHPDWVMRTASEEPLLCRDQYVLDLSRSEVEEYLWSRIAETLRSAPIRYLKWDMNRPLTNLGSAALPPDRQGEVSYRYVLALYRLQERLRREFPDLLLENCCSGGGRFDPGMLYFSPQIWCSDDNDAVERLAIQEGTALLYPLSTIGAHVSACPSGIVNRITPLTTRAAVAMAGTFGYELDATKLPAEELAQLSEQVAQYKSFQPLLQNGDYYRLSSARESNLDAWMIVCHDKGEAVITAVRILAQPNVRPRPLRLRGLDPNIVYQDKSSRKHYRGDVLMNIGFPLSFKEGDFQSTVVELKKVGQKMKHSP